MDRLTSGLIMLPKTSAVGPRWGHRHSRTQRVVYETVLGITKEDYSLDKKGRQQQQQQESLPVYGEFVAEGDTNDAKGHKRGLNHVV